MINPYSNNYILHVRDLNMLVIMIEYSRRLDLNLNNSLLLKFKVLYFSQNWSTYKNEDCLDF